MKRIRTKVARELLIVALALGMAGAGVDSASAIKVLAFGDSLTLGTGDETGDGYPKKLKKKLESGSTVSKKGVAGETTAEGLSRVGSVLKLGADAILLMEGTNDVNKIAQGQLSMESTLANLDAMITRSQSFSIEPILSSIVPRPPRAKRDRNNLITTSLVGELRELAFEREIRFADAFDIFDPELVPEAFEAYYWDEPTDLVGHLNEAGYERLAGAFADVINGVDTAAPVFGNFEPGPLPHEVPGNIRIRIPVYDFKGSSGLNLAATQLLINGKLVTDGLDGGGTPEGVQLTHKGEKPLGCRAVLRLRAEDNAVPPNVLDRTIAIYAIEGRTLLPGDADFDCWVDGDDLVAIALRLGADETSPRYGAPFDLNRDGVIDEADLDLVKQHFGKRSD